MRNGRINVATILIVDDRPENREYLLALLGQVGHRLLQAADGVQALATARAEHPDLIIADILMPTMDGYELVRHIRADPVIAHTPVIFCTAHYHEREAEALARTCGVSSVITKPSEPVTVLSAVEAALGLAPRAALPPAPEEFDREHLRLLTDKLSEKADDLRVTNERLSALIELGLQLGSELDLRRLLQSLGHAAREIVGARYAVTGILDADGVRLQSLYTSGLDAETAAQIGSPDPGVGVLRTVLREGRCVRVRNPSGDPAALGFSPSRPPIQSWLGAPIASPTRVYGYIGLIDKIGLDEFSKEDERLAGVLAAQVGRVYQNGSLYFDALTHASDLEREIFARAQTEKALAEREEHIRLLLDSTAEAIYEIDLRGCCTFANRASSQLLGFADAGQLVGRNMHALIHHTRKNGTPYAVEDCRIFRAFVQNQGSHVDDEVLWRADGSNFPAEYWSYPICRDGQVVGSVVTFLDITERRQLEDQFRRVQQRLRDVVVSSPAVLFTLELTVEDVLGISWTSDNLPEVLGYPPEAAIGSDWWLTSIHPKDLAGVRARTRADLFTRDQSTEEYRFRHGDGSYRWTRCDMRLIRDETGQPSEAVGAWSDITERKRAEEEQSKLREQLQQAQKLESVGRLAAGVAHDFNNLLTVINGYGDMLLKQLTPDDPMHESVSEMREAGQRAAVLVRQLLLLSRKQVTQASEVNLNDIITEVGKMLARVIGEDILLESVLSPSLGCVLADPGQLHQVLMNLAVNARDAMLGGGTLLIETRNVDLEDSYAEQHAEVKPGPYVQLKVSDTGIGMTKDVMSHLFEPFFTTKKPGEGTGLGLATVYGIVKQSGGSVWVYSEPGEGTAFTIYLPRIDAGVKLQKEPEAKPESLRGTETILVVEDQEQLRKMAVRVLRSFGYRVLEAANPGEALLHSERHAGPIHLLLTDVVMPGMTGPELADRIKPLRAAMETVFMSGYSEHAITGRLELTGSYLPKPFSPEALAAKVRGVLGSPRSAGTILVVDDEPGIRHLLRKLLTSVSYRVLEAENGREALRQVATSKVDLVIMDLAMPELEGVETIQALRRVLPQLKIIAISGQFAGPMLRVAEHLGAEASVAKPIQPDELLDAVARLIVG
jgi:PAS domain S-box-containing protein